jgi:cytochrome oxidase Cu insertion factor (SCO1/SenC/PrrC family)
MKALRYFVAILALLLSLTACRAQMIPDNVGQSSNGLPPALVNVGFDPQLNAQIPLDAAFTDEMSNPVRLRDYSGKKPIVLVFVYFNCPMLCSQVEQAVVGALKMISFNPGTDYQVVFVSFDPADTPDAALRKRKMPRGHRRFTSTVAVVLSSGPMASLSLRLCMIDVLSPTQDDKGTPSIPVENIPGRTG